MTKDEAVRCLRNDPQLAEFVRDAYLGPDVLDSAERFQASAEWMALRRLLGDRVAGAEILDLGAGSGIASRAFARAGARMVYALEPDPGDELGRGGIRRISAGLPIRVLGAVGEQIPLADAQVDVVYARQVLHHAQDLRRALCESARVLKKGGVFLATREPVVDDERQMQVFLENHPIHKLAGGENAFRLDQYTAAIEEAGLRIEKILGPWDSIINAFPLARTEADLRHYPRFLLARRFGWIGAVAGYLPGACRLVWWRVKRSRPPGRLYSFLARKP